MTTRQRAARDLRLINIMHRNGVVYPLQTLREARRTGLPLSYACALLEQESSGGHNVFGHDPTIFAGAGRVTRSKYRAYKAKRDDIFPRRMQGVGPLQLTWWEFQNQADSMGGCWKPSINMRLDFSHLRALMKAKGTVAGIKAYNGSGAAADAYSRNVRKRQDRWHKLLAG